MIINNGYTNEVLYITDNGMCTDACNAQGDCLYSHLHMGAINKEAHAKWIATIPLEYHIDTTDFNLFKKN